MVYLLRELSRTFPEAWIRVTDSDGEFLLVEAAEVLPRWLNPDVAENRVWINNGELLIIPQSTTSKAEKAPKDDQKFISLNQALGVLRGSRKYLLHSPIIEEEAFFRLRNYPAQIQQNLHHGLITIPRRLAFILHHLTSSIAPAIEAFYLRDPIALRPLQKKTMQSLVFPPQDLVTARIKFSRVGFAQAKSQRFTPQGAWASVRPASSDPSAEQRYELGMKVASGFEMLVSDPQNQDRPIVREIKLLLEDLEKGDERLPTDDEIKTWGTTEDDDKWMDIDFRDFERELDGRKGTGNPRSRGAAGFGDTAAHENLQKLVSRFEEFLNSDEMADSDSDDEGSGDSEEELSDEGEDKVAGFDEDEFTALMRETMGMPPEVMQEIMGPQAAKARGLGDAKHPDFTKQQYQERVAKLFANLDMAPGPEMGGKDNANVKKDVKLDEDDEEIQKLSDLMGAELRKAGALHLSDPAAAKGKNKITLPSTGPPNPARTTAATEEDEDEDSDVNVLDENYNLISNLLQSYKGQAGAGGPSGNMLGMMGVKLPRDEDSDEGDVKAAITELGTDEEEAATTKSPKTRTGKRRAKR